MIPKVPKCRVLSPIPAIAMAAATHTRIEPNAIHRYGPDTSEFRSSVAWMPVYDPAGSAVWAVRGGVAFAVNGVRASVSVQSTNASGPGSVPGAGNSPGGHPCDRTNAPAAASGSNTGG